MLVCNWCGTFKNESELKRVTEMHGETHNDYNCSCGGEFIAATQCKVCGEWFDNTEFYGVCEDCLDNHKTVGVALAIGDANRENVEINSFIAEILSADRINHILEKYVEEHFTDGCKEVVDYLEDDKSYFSEWVSEKGEDYI